MKRFFLLGAALFLAACLLASATVEATTRPEFNYAIVISKRTANDPNWYEVATELQKKYAKAKIFIYNRLDELVEPLKAFSPDYIAFVSKPQEASAEFIRQAGRLNRSLENKPYGSAVWAIVTGYNLEDALRIARDNNPPAINFGLGGMLGFIDALPEGVAYSEFTDKKADWQVKKRGGGVENRHDAPRDHTIPMINLINGNNVDGIWTSGHANTDVWSVYYPEGESYVVAERGRLFGQIDGKRRTSIQSTNPKIYLAIGNCLTARIENVDESYALAWLHAGGANQYFGFIEETYYGLMGWSTADNFFYRGARFNIAESAFVSSQALLLAVEARLAPDDVEDMEYDKDASVVYGDPAWMATIPDTTARSAEHWSTKLDRTVTGNKIRWELSVTFKKSVNFSPENGQDIRPVFAFLPERIRKGLPYGNLGSVSAYHIANNFVIVNFKGKVTAGETRRFIFESAL